MRSQLSNTILCPECEALLIKEEFETHDCISNYKFEEKYLWIRRNGKWRSIYLPLLFYLSTDFEHREDQSSNEQNPNLQYYNLHHKWWR